MRPALVRVGPRAPTLAACALASLAASLVSFTSLVAVAQEPVQLPPPPEPLRLPAPPDPAHPAAAPTGGPSLGLTSLRLMREKGVLSEEEYESAMRDVGNSTGARAENTNAVVLSKFSMLVYGFVESDTIYDTTQSFNDLAGGALVARPGPVATPPPGPPTHYAADHGRTQFSIRNSRFGFRFGAPEIAKVRTSAQLEFDFLGNQPSGITENAFFTSPTLRVRHANMRIETDVVDVLLGQYWHLFGWQGVYHPNTVEMQGLPGELYGRTPQVRVSKTVKTGGMTFEAAVAALRPVSRDSEYPDGQAGIRLAFNNWRGVQTQGATATSVMPASIAVTGDFRRIQIPEFNQLPTHSVNQNTAAIAIDGFVPIIPAKERKSHALSLNGEFVTGTAIADMYTGFTGGITMPSLPNTAGLNPAPTYPQDIDDGLVTFDQNGVMHPIQWTSYLVGLQWYLPGLDGKVWVSGNFSHMESGNSAQFTRTNPLTNPADINYPSYTLVLQSRNWFDVNFFADVGAVRLGAEYANFNDQYVDGVHAINHRVQVSGFFLF